MKRTLLVVLLLAAACTPSAGPPLQHRACQPLSPAPPKLRTVEAVTARLAELEAKYPDCAERLRQAVEAFDGLKR